MMKAIQTSKYPQEPLESRHKIRRPSPSHRRYSSYWGLASETTAKLVVNGVLSSAAIAGIIQLLPFQLTQKAKLQEIQAEVKQTEQRVNRLDINFSRGFDPQQAQSIMQEQSHRVDPTQHQVILVDKKASYQKLAPQP
ncbi:MAG: hypothetical protein NVS2B14_06580 [Chamaesiphon sp.]